MSFAMMLVFGVSLALIIFLFILKHIEARRGARFCAGARAHADVGALRIKQWLETGEWYLEQTPWLVGVLARYGVHVGALAFARIARTSAEYAHNLADFVSHKHRFERRETKSHYLKQVSEVPRRVAEPEPVVPLESPREVAPAVDEAAKPPVPKKRKPKHSVAGQQ